MNNSVSSKCGEEEVKSQEKSEERVKGSSADALHEEDRRLRWLRLQTDLLKAVLYQDRNLGPEEARGLVNDFRGRVLERFPGKEGTFELLLRPRFDRIIRERWGEPPLH